MGCLSANARPSRCPKSLELHPEVDSQPPKSWQLVAHPVIGGQTYTWSWPNSIEGLITDHLRQNLSKHLNASKLLQVNVPDIDGVTCTYDLDMGFLQTGAG